MVLIEDISSPYGAKHLEIIDNEKHHMEQDILLTAHPCQVDLFASSWQRLKTSFHVEELKITLIKTPEMWTLQATIPQHPDRPSYLPESSQSLIESEAKWGDELQFGEEFCYIQGIDHNSDVVKTFIEAWSSHPFEFHEDTPRVFAQGTCQVSLEEEVDRQGLYILPAPMSRALVEKLRLESYEKWWPNIHSNFLHENAVRLINLKTTEIQARGERRYRREKRKTPLELLEMSSESDLDRHWKRQKEDDKFSREKIAFVADPRKKSFKTLFERMSNTAPESVCSIEDEAQLVLEETKNFDLLDEKSSEIFSTEVVACDEAGPSFSEVGDPYGDVQTEETNMTDQFEKTKRGLRDLQKRLRESYAPLKRQPVFFQEARDRARKFDKKFDAFSKNLSTLIKLVQEDLK